ncbi:hypothetical protein MVES_003011 [Malassezia vespertilionis]|uniref:RRM domain-containing protein n=1 Tax=Malassezia vespertilionis TaxID=2020962 RepID=A0A2N1J918_9BASI|nr:hypothetical protein MVES_003011 [Malassezia vespertilionis]
MQYAAPAPNGVSFMPPWAGMPMMPGVPEHRPYNPMYSSDAFHPQAPMYGGMPMPWSFPPYGGASPAQPYSPVPAVHSPQTFAHEERRGKGYGRGGRGGRGNGRVPRNRPAKSVYQPDPNAERPEDSKPCRTLFVRNIAFEVGSHEFRSEFASFGEIKTWFDLIHRRGLLFVTYFDIRAAEKAKTTMHRRSFFGRTIDVHYSLPKEEDQQQHCDREKNQGTLFLLVRDAQEPIADDALRAHFGQFGDIRDMRKYKNQDHTQFVEYWDSRACIAANDALNNTDFFGGKLQLKFAWDLTTVALVTDAKNRNEAKAAAEACARHSEMDTAAQPWVRLPAQGHDAIPAPSEDRLEQAQKVQQLLASLHTHPPTAEHDPERAAHMAQDEPACFSPDSPKHAKDAQVQRETQDAQSALADSLAPLEIPAETPVS